MNPNVYFARTAQPAYNSFSCLAPAVAHGVRCMPNPAKLKELLDKQAALRKKIKEAERLAGTGAGYGRHRDAAAERSRKKSEAGREIGPLPPVKDPERKELCGLDLKLYAETYFPGRFFLRWSAAHLEALTILQSTALDGGCFAFGMQRGGGKTTLAEVAVLWAISYGWRRYGLIIAANEDPLAVDILKSIKGEIETNDLLLEDFPEICYPVRRLEGIHHRAGGQTLDGERTLIEFTAHGIRLPRVAGSPCSGSVIEAVGMTAAIRGRKFRAHDGKQIRPDFVLLDDFQTRESAKSFTQTRDRLAIIKGDILGLAGPKTKIALVAPCTVIYKGDGADQLLDPEKNPRFNGRRTKRLIEWPRNMDLWDEYSQVRALRSESAATAFYAQNRQAMDECALVSWEDRFKPDELSALQGAMNDYYDDPRSFFAESQLEPLDDMAATAKELNADEIKNRLTNVSRGLVPREATTLVAFIDVGQSCHWWAVAALDQQFTGSVIDYGPFPLQNRNYFDARDARPALTDLYPGLTDPQLVYASLKDLVPKIMGRSWLRHETGAPMKVERLLIDCGKWTDAVHQFCRECPGYSPLLMPSKGYATSSNTRPMNEWARKPGEKVGWNWRITAGAGGSRGRFVLFDPDQWKTFLSERLTTPPGGPGALMLFGSRPDDHELLAAHLTAEVCTEITIQKTGRTFDKWAERPDRRDNHLFDVFTGLMVCASTLGLTWGSIGATRQGEMQPAPPTPLKYADVRIRHSPTAKPANTPPEPAATAAPPPLRYADVRGARETARRPTR